MGNKSCVATLQNLLWSGVILLFIKGTMYECAVELRTGQASGLWFKQRAGLSRIVEQVFQMTITTNGCDCGLSWVTASMHSPLPASHSSMSPSVTVSEIQAPACKRLRTSLNAFDELVTYMSQRVPPETPESKMNLVHWWQMNEQVVLKLSLVAKRLPCVPACSSSS